MPFPTVRPRRLRPTPALRRLVAETRLHPAELVLPMFVKEGLDRAARRSASMPGVVQHTRESLRKAAHEAVEAGVGGLMLFGVPGDEGRGRLGGRRPGRDPQRRAPRRGRRGRRRHRAHGDLCLDEFTYARPLRRADARTASVDNDATLERYAAMAVAQAAAGAHVVGAVRDDGRPGRRDPPGPGRRRLRATCRSWPTRPSTPRRFYGPFREAAECAPQFGDRSTYQQDPARTSTRRCARWRWTSPRAPTS